MTIEHQTHGPSERINEPTAVIESAGIAQICLPLLTTIFTSECDEMTPQRSVLVT